MKGRIGNKQRILHILDAITEIESYTKNTDLNTFLNNSMMRFATIKQMEIIGEASVHITEESRTKFSDVEWKQMIGMRNILVHEYFDIDTDIIWQIVINDLPGLREKVTVVLEEWADE